MEIIEQKDISREGLNLTKFVYFWQLVFQKATTEVLGAYTRFGDIDFDTLSKKGKKAIILDVDDCIAPHHGDILVENMEILNGLVSHGWKIIIFSNMEKTPRYRQLEDLGVHIHTSKYAKPHTQGFLECIEKLSCNKEDVVGIGDNFLTDGGIKQIGVDFIKIQALRTDKNRSIKRKLQIAFQDMIDNIAKKRGHLQYNGE